MSTVRSSGSTRISARTSSRDRLACFAGAAVGIVAVVIALVDAPHAGKVALWGVAAVAVASWAVAAVVLVQRTPGLGLTCSLVSLGGGLAMLIMRVSDRHGLGVDSAARRLADIAALLTMAAFVHVISSLPNGVLKTRGRQLSVLAWYVVALALCAYYAAGAKVLSPWPLALGWCVAVASAMPALRTRYVDASARSRQLVQSLVAGAALALTFIVILITLHSLVDWPIDVGAPLLALSCLVPLGLAFGASNVASHVDRLLVHLITALGTVTIVAGAYLLAVRGFDKAPTNHTDRNLLWWAMAAAAVAAVAQLALRGRFSRIATSFTYGAREAPDEVVRSFGTRMTRAIPMDELLLQLVESLRKTLSLASAEIFTGNGEVLDLVVSVPDRPPRSLHVTRDERLVISRAGVSGNAWASVWLPSIAASDTLGPMRVAPISHAGELLGIIVVSKIEGAVAFREEDDRVLADLARQVGLALHNAQLDTALQSSMDELRRQADELRASRARVVASGDAERRRVERNLHDGAQQHLVALAVNLRLTKDVVTEDPEMAVQMLDELGEAVQETIRELRELAHGIYPPLLVDSGLGEALKAVVNRSPLDIELITDGIGRYGGDVEAAVYFCCLEALQNAGKHAPSAHVVVRVWEESGSLLFEVRDDGPGFDIRTAQRGHGYVNMMDRLGAIGGAVRW
ncbi:MAG TPA: histidine kinase, partial [Acidimicrobiales bacterium]|nr:histidine kinase [Acidimicrobiales bacterium]